jgi:RarD protein
MPDLEYRKGVLLAVCAYTIWGVAPLYFKLLHNVPATEILMHRVIWSFIFMIIMMQFIGVNASLKAPLFAEFNDKQIFPHQKNHSLIGSIQVFNSKIKINRQAKLTFKGYKKKC